MFLVSYLKLFLYSYNKTKKPATIDGYIKDSISIIIAQNCSFETLFGGQTDEESSLPKVLRSTLKNHLETIIFVLMNSCWIPSPNNPSIHLTTLHLEVRISYNGKPNLLTLRGFFIFFYNSYIKVFNIVYKKFKTYEAYRLYWHVHNKTACTITFEYGLNFYFVTFLLYNCQT